MKVCAGLLIDRLIRAPPPAKFATMMTTHISPSSERI